MKSNAFAELHPPNWSSTPPLANMVANFMKRLSRIIHIPARRLRIRPHRTAQTGMEAIPAAKCTHWPPDVNPLARVLDRKSATWGARRPSAAYSAPARRRLSHLRELSSSANEVWVRIAHFRPSGGEARIHYAGSYLNRRGDGSR